MYRDISDKQEMKITKILNVHKLNEIKYQVVLFHCMYIIHLFLKAGLT